MKNIPAHSAAWLILCLILCTVGFAQITPVGDSYTNTADATTNYGAKTLLDVDGATQITYIQFPLSSIPSGATVSAATLKLYVNSVTTAGTFNVDYVNGAWAESTIDASNAPSLGGTIASNVNVTTTDKNQYILINVTSAVQAWLSGSETNNGLALVANSTFNATFDSKENTTTSHPAELDIAYAGGDGTITGVTTASGSGLTGGGTSGNLDLSLTTACATNQVLQWNGSAWACAAAGTGTITGVTAGTDLTGGGTSGNVTLNLNTSALNSTYAQLSTANTFTGNQTVNGNLSATGLVTGSGFQIGSNLFDYGSYLNQNAFLGFAGSAAASQNALFDTAVGFAALFNDTALGGANTALGNYTLPVSYAGSNNTASGYYALNYNTTGSNNTASGSFTGLTADNSVMTGWNNTFLGSSSGLSTGTLNNATAIGANAEVSASNALVLGGISGVNNATADTFVGIGTTAPAYRLQVDAAPPNNSGLDAVAVTSGGSNYVSSLLLKNTSTSGLYLREGAGTNTTYLASSGSLEFVTKDTGNPNNPSGSTVSIDTSGDVTIPGNLKVNGSVSKGSGSFQIDHPLDPANKYLYHSFVESPDMMNIYNGVAILDAHGSAWITLPDYFEALNRDFRYQLTSMGRPQPSLYIATEISGNRFRIAGGKAGGKVSWLVTGIRHDAYANANRIPVEVEKPPQEQGQYLHPELFGAPPDRTIGYTPPTFAAGEARDSVSSR